MTESRDRDPEPSPTSDVAEPTVELSGLPRGQYTPSLEPHEFHQPEGDPVGDAAVPPVVAAPVIPRGPRRWGRRAGILIASLLVVVLLVSAAVVGDGVFRRSVERSIADQLQQQLGPAARVSVTIPGTPFTTQVLDHRFPTIQVQAPGAQLQGLQCADLTFTADGVTTTADRSASTIDTLRGSALLTYASVSAKAGTQLTYSSPTQLAVTYDTTVLGIKVKVRAVGTPTLDVAAQQIGVDNVHASIVGVSVPDFLTRQVVQQAVQPVQLSLPAGLRVTSLTMQPDGILVDVEGHDVKTEELR